MAISLKHSFTSAVADEGDTSLVQPSNWNAEHDLVIATSTLIGRTTASTGPAEEISVGTGLLLSGGSLTVGTTTPQVNSINTFTASQVIETTDNSNAALRITQLGTGPSILVQDSANPDSTPFAVAADGNVSIGATSTSAKLEVIGGAANSITALGTEDAATVAITNSDVGGLGRISKTLYEIGNLPLAAVAAVYSAFNGGGDIGGDLVFGTQTNLAGGVVERLRISKDGAYGVAGANYGTSGQVLTSGGSGAAPSWATPSSGGATLTSTQAFTASGTYTPTSGTTSAIVFVQAAGGGGGGADNDNDGCGGGAGGCVVLYLTTTDFASIGTPTVTIGAGGAGGNNTGGNGADGGNTSFGTLAEAQGGKGGESQDAVAGAIGGEGGDYITLGTYLIAGEDGRNALAPASDVGGSGGNAAFGAGGAGGVGQQNGAAGAGYGSGGGGASATGGTGRTGGSGAGGYVLVLEYA